MNDVQSNILRDIRRILVESRSDLLVQFDELVIEGNAKKVFLWLDEQMSLGKLSHSLKDHMTDLYYSVR